MIPFRTIVKTIWIEDLLEQSLAKELRIALDLTEQPDVVALALNVLVQELNRPPQSLPTGTAIIEVFEQMGGALLILGAPVAGKTTLLLEEGKRARFLHFAMDEVAVEHRGDCVETINIYRQEHGLVPLISSSDTCSTPTSRRCSRSDYSQNGCRLSTAIQRNQGIRNSAFSALVGGLVYGLLSGADPFFIFLEVCRS